MTAISQSHKVDITQSLLKNKHDKSILLRTPTPPNPIEMEEIEKRKKGKKKKMKINPRKSSETTTSGRNTSGAEPAKAAIIVCKQCVQAKPVSKWVQGGRDVY